MAPSYKNLKLATLGAFIVSFLIISPHFDLAHATTAATSTDNTTQPLPTIESVTSDLIKMELYVSSSNRNLMDNDTIEGGNLTLYRDEEVTLLKCVAPKLNFSGEELVVHVHKKNGSTLKLGSKMSSSNDSNEFLTAELTSFRVPADVIAFSCSAKTSESSSQEQRIWINVTVLDLPSELTVRWSESRNLTVNLTSGAEVNLNCQLPGPSQENTTLWDELLEMNSSYNRTKEYKSNSTFEFVRFYRIAKEDLICNENLSEKTDGEERHFIFNMKMQNPAPRETTNTPNATPLPKEKSTTLTTTKNAERESQSPLSSTDSTLLRSGLLFTTKATLTSSANKPKEAEKFSSTSTFLTIFFTVFLLSGFLLILEKKKGWWLNRNRRILRPRAHIETEENGMLL